MPISVSRVIADGASLVCSVRQHQVTGERGLDRDLRGLVVADLADQHDVRVAAQDRAQRGGERQPGLRVHLHLVDAGQPVLHRVLDRDDVDLGLATMFSVAYSVVDLPDPVGPVTRIIPYGLVKLSA